MRIIRCDICKRDINPTNPYFVMQFNKAHQTMLISDVPWEKNDICMDCYDKIKDMVKRNEDSDDYVEEDDD